MAGDDISSTLSFLVKIFINSYAGVGMSSAVF
jgi:hypothetical protein